MTSLPTDSTPPEWAVAKVNAALKLGMRVPDIETLLIAEGLSPTLAAAVVNSVVESRFVPPSQPWVEWGEGMHRMLSAILVGVCLLFAHWYGGSLSVGRTVLWVLVPVAWIWFPELLSSSTETYLRGFGWLFLLLICGYRVALLLITG